MPDKKQLREFLDAAKQQGATDEFLVRMLSRRGWPEQDIYTELGEYWITRTGVEIPGRPANVESAKDAFLYLLSFATLATWAIALGSMLFTFIDWWVADPVSQGFGGTRDSVNYQIASILVAFPIYLGVMRMLSRETTLQPERLESGVRKWLTYIALLFAAGTVICDLILFLHFFLQGGMTARFLLKALAVLVIAGGIFWYYIWYYIVSLKWTGEFDVASAVPYHRAFGGAAAIAVVTCLVIGIWNAGSPAHQRRIQADQARSRDLDAISAALRRWHAESARLNLLPLPASLQEISASPVISGVTGPFRLRDRETNRQYEYYQGAGSLYELCAVFATDSKEQDAFHSNMPGSLGSWKHGKGRTCFEKDAAMTN